MSRPVKAVLWTLGGLVGLTVAAAVGFVILVQSAWFKNQIRERIVSVAEKATGGRVEIGSFNYDWHALTAEVAPFVLHGSEPPSAPPFFRAAKIRIGLRIISAFKKQVDIASLQVDQPQLYVTVAPDGASNVPIPTLARTIGSFTDQLLDLKVQHFKLRNGLFEYNSKRIPVDVQGDHLQAALAYDSNGPCYRADISSRPLRVSSPQLKQPLIFDLASRVAFESNAVEILETSLANGAAKVQLKGTVSDLALPRAALEVKASAPLNELKKYIPIPLEPRGDIAFEGRGSLESGPFRYKLDGKLTARGLGITYHNVALKDVAAASGLELSPEKLSLPDLDISVLHGAFRGSAELTGFRKLAISGTAQGFALRDLLQLSGRPSRAIEWHSERPRARERRTGARQSAQRDRRGSTGNLPCTGPETSARGPHGELRSSRSKSGTGKLPHHARVHRSYRYGRLGPKPRRPIGLKGSERRAVAISADRRGAAQAASHLARRQQRQL